ncbi:MAG: DUF1015 domain-containing protein [Bacteroidota bacterium]
MAEIRPFRAWRYNPEKVHDINLKFSPLFDVVRPEQLEQLYAIPNNSIHLSVPRSHEEAQTKLNAWKKEKVIRLDPIPGIYVYYQQFSLFGQRKGYTRKGFICMINPRKENIILHENTLIHSVNDRIALLEKTKLNVSPTHGLYQDASFELEAIMDRYMEHPLYEYIDYQGVINKLAIIQDPKDIGPFLEKIAEQPVYLADGHHRLESSRVFSQKRQENGEAHNPQSWENFHMMYLTNMAADDLRILPIHRVYKPAEKLDIPILREQLQQYFDLEDVSRSRKPLFDLLKGQKHAFGLVTLGRRWIMRLKMSPWEALGEADLPDVLKQLDYTLLHMLVFDRILGIPYEDQPHSQEIMYEKGYSNAVKDVNTSQAACSFIMNEVSVEQMLEVCSTGYKMPQKSTYFYPKVVSGLVFASIDDHEIKSSFDSRFSVTEKSPNTP